MYSSFKCNHVFSFLKSCYHNTLLFKPCWGGCREHLKVKVHQTAECHAVFIWPPSACVTKQLLITLAFCLQNQHIIFANSFSMHSAMAGHILESFSELPQSRSFCQEQKCQIRTEAGEGRHCAGYCQLSCINSSRTLLSENHQKKCMNNCEWSTDWKDSGSCSCRVCDLSRIW